MERISRFRRFYRRAASFLLGLGQVWLDKAREDDLRGQVANDPHSPAKFRINGMWSISI
jgi:predicted metalloendopeptidase